MVTRHTTMVTMVTIDDDIELKPCPFCGSTAGLYVSYEGNPFFSFWWSIM